MSCKTTLALMTLIAGIGLTHPALAWTSTTAEYEADWTMETAEGAVQGRIHSAGGGKERRELDAEGETMVMIVRPDKKLIWNLMPSGRLYFESALGSDDDQAGTEDISQYDIEETVVGDEVVNGVKTTKSKILMTGKRPGLSKMGGFWWTTKEGIVMKMDVIAVDKGSKQRIKMELDNLKVGKQNPKLFEIPPGYSKMSMGFGAMGGGASHEGGGKGGLNLKGALDLLK